MKTYEQYNIDADKIIELGIPHIKEVLVNLMVAVDNCNEHNVYINNKLKSLEIELTIAKRQASRDCLPIEKRTVEWYYEDSDICDIYINPCTGVIRVRISDNYSASERNYYELLVTQILNYDQFRPYTYRGHASYNAESNKYYVNLKGDKNSKIHGVVSIHFEVKGD